MSRKNVKKLLIVIAVGAVVVKAVRDVIKVNAPTHVPTNTPKNLI